MALTSFGQIKDQDLDGITVTSKKITVRDIIDSVYTNAPRNYAEPGQLSGTYLAYYNRGADTAFYTQVPVYLRKGKEFTYGSLLWDSTRKGVVVQDHIQSKAQWDRVFSLNDRPFPVATNVMTFMKSLDDISDTKRVLYASDQNETDPHFYLLFRPKGKIGIPIILRPFISSLDKDSLFSYTILKIRRKGWVVTYVESALLLNDPAKLTELIRTSSFTRAQELIAAAKAQERLRRFGIAREWWPGPDGRYRIHRFMHTDNLLNLSLALFKKFPDPEGYIGTSETVYEYETAVPESLQPFSLDDLLKDRKKY
ncbi:MAG: hypothetical protein EOP52_01320 [Sphingobacteriales bacterium]|nr:MAG: hypothetical protein EOP52_01320 [Sphingobacteriales bacterium]